MLNVAGARVFVGEGVAIALVAAMYAVLNKRYTRRWHPVVLPLPVETTLPRHNAIVPRIVTLCLCALHILELMPLILEPEWTRPLWWYVIASPFAILGLAAVVVYCETLRMCIVIAVSAMLFFLASLGGSVLLGAPNCTMTGSMSVPAIAELLVLLNGLLCALVVVIGCGILMLTY